MKITMRMSWEISFAKPCSPTWKNLLEKLRDTRNQNTSVVLQTFLRATIRSNVLKLTWQMSLWIVFLRVAIHVTWARIWHVDSAHFNLLQIATKYVETFITSDDYTDAHTRRKYRNLEMVYDGCIIVRLQQKSSQYKISIWRQCDEK